MNNTLCQNIIGTPKMQNNFWYTIFFLYFFSKIVIVDGKNIIVAPKIQNNYGCTIKLFTFAPNKVRSSRKALFFYHDFDNSFSISSFLFFRREEKRGGGK